MGEPEPGVEGVDRAGAEIDGIRLRQILPFVQTRSGMRHENLRRLLEVRGDRDERKLRLCREAIADLVAAHEEFDLAEQEQQGAVRLGAAGNDRDIEPVFLVSAVGCGLIKSARLRLREPVRAELHLVERQRRLGQADNGSGHGSKSCNAHSRALGRYGGHLKRGLRHARIVRRPRAFGHRQAWKA